MKITCMLNSKQLYEFVVREIKGISFCYVTNDEEYEDEAKSLKARFAQSKRIVGTQKLHYFKPISFLIIGSSHGLLRSLIGNKRSACNQKSLKLLN